MKEINLGRILIENRHRRGITQDELASYMGVSKASVSKWETATTYPDITLLPQLATFFNISIDELMGYAPQMNRQDIRKLHRQLSLDFSTKPFETVMAHCREISKKYFSCAPLLFQLGSLYVNYSMLAGSPEKSAAILKEAQTLFVRVKQECEDRNLATQATSMEALCLLQLGRPAEVLDLLDPLDMVRMSPETLLSTAYHATGNQTAAKEILQAGTYTSMIELVSLLSSYMGLCMDDEATGTQIYERILSLSETFSLKTLHPSVLLPIYLCAAQMYLTHRQQENALRALQQYTDLATGDIYPLDLHGDAFFNLLDGWLEKTFALGCDLPREERTIRQSMCQVVADNPAFVCLKDNPQFQNFVQRLKANEEGCV